MLQKWLRRFSLAVQGVCALFLVLFILTQVNDFLGWIFVALGLGVVVHSVVGVLNNG